MSECGFESSMCSILLARNPNEQRSCAANGGLRLARTTFSCFLWNCRERPCTVRESPRISSAVRGHCLRLSLQRGKRYASTLDLHHPRLVLLLALVSDVADRHDAGDLAFTSQHQRQHQHGGV